MKNETQSEKRQKLNKINCNSKNLDRILNAKCRKLDLIEKSILMFFPENGYVSGIEYGLCNGPPGNDKYPDASRGHPPEVWTNTPNDAKAFTQSMHYLGYIVGLELVIAFL